MPRDTKISFVAAIHKCGFKFKFVVIVVVADTWLAFITSRLRNTFDKFIFIKSNFFESVDMN